MTRAATLLLVLALALGTPAAGTAAADTTSRGRSDTAPSALETELDAIGSDFQAKSTSRLIGRVAKDGTVRLALESDVVTYKSRQAEEVLDAWFEKRSNLSVERTKVTGSTGRFDLKFRVKDKAGVREKALLVTVSKETDGTYRLTQITVE